MAARRQVRPDTERLRREHTAHTGAHGADKPDRAPTPIQAALALHATQAHGQPQPQGVIQLPLCHRTFPFCVENHNNLAAEPLHSPPNTPKMAPKGAVTTTESQAMLAR
ncbi:MAG: hypothetical protein ACRCXH_09090 [Shewanella sp.]